MSKESQIRIKKLEKQKEIRERKKNVVIKEWETPKRDSLEVAVQKML